jgi:MoaD family protein
MAKINVRFNGLFRQIAGKEEDIIEPTEATLEGLVRVLERSYGERFARALRDPGKQLSPGVTAFVNGRPFDVWQVPLADGDEVTFLPFISGG